MRLIPLPANTNLEENQKRIVVWSDNIEHERPWEAILTIGEKVTVSAVVRLTAEDIQDIKNGAELFTLVFFGPNVPEMGFGGMQWDAVKENV